MKPSTRILLLFLGALVLTVIIEVFHIPPSPAHLLWWVVAPPFACLWSAGMHFISRRS